MDCYIVTKSRNDIVGKILLIVYESVPISITLVYTLYIVIALRSRYVKKQYKTKYEADLFLSYNNLYSIYTENYIKNSIIIRS